VRTNSAFLTRLLRNEAVQSAQLDTGLIAMRAATVIPPVEAAPELVAGAAHAILMRGRRDPYLYDEEALARRPLWDQPNGFRLNRAPRPLSLQLTDGSRSYESVPDENRTWIIDSPNGVLATLDGDTRMFRIARTDGAASGTATDGAILSPMPGRVTAVDVAAGDTVTTGQRLVTLEAMKMEHSLTAPFDGTVAELNAEAGAQVTEGALLVRIEKAE
jgi:3-methylcrotonyl-CoA carboxylase alpha subunit